MEDEYTAYCFNEACCYISVMLEKGEKPNFKEPEFYKSKPKNYRNFSDFYNTIK